MPSKLNTEFNYRYQIEGNTPWEKIKQLRGFYEGRLRAKDSEAYSDLRYQAKIKEIESLKKTNAEEHLIMLAEADLLELESARITEKEAFKLNDQEIEIIEKLLLEYQAIAEPTRIPGYTDEQMFEANAANEFTAMIGKEIYAEIMAVGHASPAKLRNAMSNPYTMKALKDAALLPEQMQYIEGGRDPLNISLNCTVIPTLQLDAPSVTPTVETYRINSSIENSTRIDLSAIEGVELNIPAQPKGTLGEMQYGEMQIFPITIYTSEYKKDTSYILKYIENLEYKLHEKLYAEQTKDSFVLQHPELAEIKKFIEEQLEIYCKDSLKMTSPLRITQSWINRSSKGRAHSYHTHPNSLISGVFYFRLTDSNPPIKFEKPLGSTFLSDISSMNGLNAQSFFPFLKTNDLILFPSSLGHSVDANESDEVRISLSFNTFATGSLGSKETLTYLDLPE